MHIVASRRIWHVQLSYDRDPRLPIVSRLQVQLQSALQKGSFAFHTLSNWPSCMKYVLVDLWQQQSNYADVANVDTTEQERIMRQAITTLARFRDKIEICQNYTTVCTTRYPDNFFDYIYVDARHDYKGVSEDLVAWWPKLKDGGVFAGHDYVTNDDGPMQSGQNWTINYDGSIDPFGRAVKGAVDDFASSVGRQVLVTYREARWNSWLMVLGDLRSRHECSATKWVKMFDINTSS